jgi:hypothetical protein
MAAKLADVAMPGIVYSVWRVTSRYKACPACGAPNMIPLDSPRAKQAMATGTKP